MPSDETDIARAIGGLQASVEESTRQRSAMFRKLDEMQREMHEISGAVKSVAEKQAALERHIAERVDPAIGEFRALKNKGMGVVAFIGFMAAGSGAALMKLLNIGGAS